MEYHATGSSSHNRGVDSISSETPCLYFDWLNSFDESISETQAKTTRFHLCTTVSSDSLSSLPDEILQEILSLLPTKIAIRTSVLSKRWKHVWSETPCLYFDYFGKSIRETIASYKGAKIKSFRLRTSVSSKKKAELINSLIEFAMSRNTEKLSLYVYSKNLYEDYTFPDFLFSNSSVKQLILRTQYDLISRGCTVSWTSLKSLNLSSCELSDVSFSEMMSGCPMLESLTLGHIEPIECLDLSKWLRLKKLNIYLRFWAKKPMQIVAPHIRSLRLMALKVIESKSICTLVDVSSLTKATIDFHSSWYEDYPSEIVAFHAMVQSMLGKLQNVEKLTLGVSFLQILSMGEFEGVHFPTCKVKTLTLRTRILRSVVPGIARLLQNLSALKKITLHTFEVYVRADEIINGYMDRQDLNLDHCWRLINEVSLDSWECEFAEPKLVGSFVEFLLANTRTLETLVLWLGNNFDKSRLRELSEITHTLSDDNKVLIILD